MQTHPLRLMPGADLRLALEAHARAHLPAGGFVVCGIGSLDGACLRLADADAGTWFDGPHEIIALSGSVSPDGAHLHMAVASSTGAVVGGHVTAGNRVRTTVEVLLADCPGWQLGRRPDPATGWAELVVDRLPPQPPA